MKQPATPHNQAPAPLGAAPVARGVNQVAEQAIRERAYSIFESSPDAARTPELDWLEAEDQLRSESKRASSDQAR